MIHLEKRAIKLRSELENEEQDFQNKILDQHEEKLEEVSANYKEKVGKLTKENELKRKEYEKMIDKIKDEFGNCENVKDNELEQVKQDYQNELKKFSSSLENWETLKKIKGNNDIKIRDQEIEIEENKKIISKLKEKVIFK